MGKRDNSFIEYNNTVMALKMIEIQYSNETKEMCDLSMYSLLSNIYNNRELYSKALEYLKENNLYEKYSRAIFEIYFNPPKEKQAKAQDGNSNNSNNGGKQDGKSSIKTKEHDVKIDSDFINRLFKNEDED